MLIYPSYQVPFGKLHLFNSDILGKLEKLGGGLETLAMKKSGRSNSYQSLCEMSLQVAANMIKLSSFSMANLSLGNPPSTRTSASSTSSSTLNALTNNNHILHPQFPGSSRSQVPKSSSKPIIYLIQPTELALSSYIVWEESGVDGKASNYIRKVHEHNQSVSDEPSTLPPFLLPSPPRVVK